MAEVAACLTTGQAAARLGVAEPSEVSRILQVDLSTLSRNLERLRARGWIEAVPDRDARVHPFQVTDPGREMIRQAYPLWQEAQQKATALLGEEGTPDVGWPISDAGLAIVDSMKATVWLDESVDFGSLLSATAPG